MRLHVIGARAHHMVTMNDFDYAAPAEVYASPRAVTYRRFARGAEAIRFAMEELAPDVLYGTVIEANEQRFDAAAIRRLYESRAYPLARSPLI